MKKNKYTMMLDDIGDTGSDINTFIDFKSVPASYHLPKITMVTG